MATPLIQKLQDDLNSINDTYASRFAGQSRATRDVAELDALVTQLRSVLSRVDAIPAAARGADLNKIREDAQSQLDLFQAERGEIQKAKAAGPSLEKFSPLAAAANFVFARYAHHYAGKSRNTRDLERLDEMIEDLRKIEDEMTSVIKQFPREEFRGDLDVVRQNMKMYRDERGEIVKAQGAGSLEDQAGLMAQLANDQFEVYRVHFAGQSRATRRPQLLSRVIASLERVQKNMRSLDARNVNADFNRGNIGIVEENLTLYRTELTEIRKAREGMSIGDLQGNLGDAANQIFAEYRENFAGKNRTTVSLPTLVNICDKLEEVHRQMRDLGRTSPTDMNTKNLGIVNDQLVLFNREYEQIAQAQGVKS